MSVSRSSAEYKSAPVPSVPTAAATPSTPERALPRAPQLKSGPSLAVGASRVGPAWCTSPAPAARSRWIEQVLVFESACDFASASATRESSALASDVSSSGVADVALSHCSPAGARGQRCSRERHTWTASKQCTCAAAS
eukprot:3991581-Pleurochrysis_carterae.AAC.1